MVPAKGPPCSSCSPCTRYHSFAISVMRDGRCPIDIKPHAYDPATQPELFQGVLARRVSPYCRFRHYFHSGGLAAMFIFAFGIVTLGLGFALYWLLPSATVILGNCLFWMTLGGPASATPSAEGAVAGPGRCAPGAAAPACTELLAPCTPPGRSGSRLRPSAPFVAAGRFLQRTGPAPARHRRIAEP